MTLAERTRCSNVSVPSPSPPCRRMLCSPHSAQAPTDSLTVIAGGRVPKSKSTEAALCQPQGGGFPKRKPSLPAHLSSSRASGLPLEAWRQLRPARDQGAPVVHTRSFLPISYPNFQFGEVNMQFFSLPCNFPCCGCQSSWEM